MGYEVKIGLSNKHVHLSQKDLDVLFKDYVYSFEETKMAFKSVFAAQLTDRRSADEYAEAQYNITTQKDINSISLEDYSQIKMKEKTTSRGFGVYTVTNRSKIVGKNGKIAQLKNEGELCFSPLSSNYSSEKEKRVISIDINYYNNLLSSF